MKLSVIIPAYGRQELLIRCLKSLDSGQNGEHEVCVVDDGSGIDETLIREAALVKYPLIWRSFSGCRGRSAARNEGVQATTGEIIVFLDSDMEVLNGFIDAHIKIHSDNQDCAAVGKIIWPENGSFYRYIGSRGVNKIKDDIEIPPWYFVTGNSSVKRRNLPVEKPFDETFSGWGGEDLDLALKLHTSGVKFLFAKEAVSYHSFNGTLKNHVSRTFNYGFESLPLLIKKYPEIQKITRIEKLSSHLYKIAVNDILFYPLLEIAKLFDKTPLPMILFDYLTFAAYSRGWLRSVHK